MVRRPPAPCATTWPPSAVTTLAQSPCGSAWHSEPTRVPRLRTIGSAISGAAAAIVGCVAGSSAERSRVGVPAERADPEAAVGVLLVVVEAGQVVDVDEQLGAGEPELHQRHQALAAGQDLGLAVALLEQRDRLLEAAGHLVAEPGRVHVRASRRAVPAPSRTRASGVGASGVGGGAGRLAGSGIATGVPSMSVGSGRGSWCGGHGPCTGWPATPRYSTSCGKAKTVGLLPVFGASLNSSAMRGLPARPPSSAT